MIGLRTKLIVSCFISSTNIKTHLTTGNSIRLPIGYFTLGPAYCHDTPFASASAVYQSAWPAVKNLVSRCYSRGIGVLVDLHALPGGANGGDHSGTNSGKAEFWKKKSNQELATRCLLFIAKEARSMDGVIGIQLCNEAEWDAHGMYGWYDNVISQMSGVDNTMPIYISDAWNLGQAVKYCNGKNSLGSGKTNPIVIDTHLYWAFSDDDKRKTPQQITQEVHGKLAELDGHDGNVVDHGAAQVVIGEYSCVLTEDSWGKAGGHEKPQLVHGFGQAQSQRYQSRTGGSFFWTYRMVSGCICQSTDLMLTIRRTGWMAVSGASSSKSRVAQSLLLTICLSAIKMYSLGFKTPSHNSRANVSQLMALTAITGTRTTQVNTSMSDLKRAGNWASTTRRRSSV